MTTNGFPASPSIVDATFAGRRDELRELHALLWDGPDAAGALVLHGPPGIGKTVLLTELACSVPRVLHGRDLASLVPEEGTLSALVAARDQLLHDVGDQRTLVVVDDADELDPALARVLLFVARRVSGTPLGFVFVSHRPGALYADSGLALFRLGGLDDDAAALVASESAPVPLNTEARAAILGVCDGNPGWITEVIAAWSQAELQGRARLPSVAAPARPALEWWAPVFDGLPAATRHALLLLAAWETTDLASLALDSDVALSDLTPAELAGIVVVSNERVRFARPLLRSVTYFRAPLTDRDDAHLRIAAVLDAPGDADRRAWHRAAAQHSPDEAIAAALEQTVDLARSRGGASGAARAWERAADMSTAPAEQGRRLVAAASAYWQAAQGDRATELLTRADSLVTDPAARATSAFVAGAIALGSGHPDDAFSVLVSGARSVSQSDPEMAVNLASRATGIAWWAGLGDWSQSAMNLVRSSVDGDSRFARFARSTSPAGIDILAHRFDTGGPALTAALTEAEEFSDPRWLLYASECAGLLGDDIRAVTLQSRAIEELRSSGSAPELPFALELHAYVNALHGRLDASTAAAQEGLRLAEDAHEEYEGSFQLAMLAHLAALRGEADSARDFADRAVAAAPDERYPTARWAVGRLELSLDRPESAYRELAPLFAAGTGHPIVSLYATPDLVEAAVDTGHIDAVQDAVAAFEEWATHGSLWAQATRFRVRALLAEPDEAAAYFERALDDPGSARRPFEHARTHLLLGRHLRRLRRRLDSRDHLRTALASFTSLGLAAWADRARAELRASGETVGTHEGGPSAQLTAHESRVAALVADGSSNREVALELHLSPRTVEYHLAKVYVKLGISSRAQLPAALRPPH
ncbi:LuxR C-terminal-related transcriptional regulator [uncultured Microbacterium sp.]|uniref:helix-turn-helix transcriptional regulator n=1 Tax=uncultured Microbacterium sp. TaxID=191216 RepID=UPI0028D6210F|nr:LuxR C-terminal-related transcriptional regulator [uncultured Microbacterium sp.]